MAALPWLGRALLSVAPRAAVGLRTSGLRPAPPHHLAKLSWRPPLTGLTSRTVFTGGAKLGRATYPSYTNVGFVPKRAPITGLRKACERLTTRSFSSKALLGPKGLAGVALPVGRRLLSTTAMASASSMSSSAFTGAMTEASRRSVGRWLALCSAWVFSMVVLGGVTRLTRSGLSMTEWRFAGERPPITLEDWRQEFAKYRASPEFKKVNMSMTLEEFKFIYWMEYAHRMWGRVLGLVFALPFAYYSATRQLSGPLSRRLLVLFALGGGQGLVGWWMVKSGLQEPERKTDTPRVSPYRLAAHLTSAFAIYSGLVWTTLQVLRPTGLGEDCVGEVARRNASRLGRHLRPFALLVGCTAISGAFVAGLDACHAYNTFPLMGDPPSFFPQDYWLEANELGFLRNAFENTCAVQFHHRCLALTTLTAATALLAVHGRRRLPVESRRLLYCLCGVAWGQVGLGITTLLTYVPVHLGSAHQAGALTLMSVVLAAVYGVRAPARAATTARRAAAAAAGAAPKPSPAVV